MRYEGSLEPDALEFQSAPAIAGGRCARTWAAYNWGEGFQSAPAIAGGRCPDKARLVHDDVQFQSAPAIAGGRCMLQDSGLFSGWNVSIRARHCWRAMPRSVAGSLLIS